MTTWQANSDGLTASSILPNGGIQCCLLKVIPTTDTVLPYVEPITITWMNYQEKARQALVHSDITMHRISEGFSLGLIASGAADVTAWVNWRRQLRAILSQPQPATIPANIPAQPPYPKGT